MQNQAIKIMLFMALMTPCCTALATDEIGQPDSKVSLIETRTHKDNFYPDCSKSPLKLKQCEASFCKGYQLGGMVYYKIVGVDAEGKCIYRERIESMGVLQCNIPINKLPKSAGQLTFEERDLYCKPVSVISNTFLVTLATSLSDMFPESDAISTQDSVKAPIEVKHNDRIDQTIKSIMLTTDEQRIFTIEK